MKQTIAHRVSKLYIVLLTLTILLTWGINCTFLVQFYSREKKEVLMNAYQAINAVSVSDYAESQGFYFKMGEICGKGNLSVIVLDDNAQPVYSSTNSAESFVLHRQVLGYIYGYESQESEDLRILFQNEKYVLQKRKSDFTELNYMEMWGRLDKGGYFLIRTPIEGIRESVNLSNRFLLYVGLSSIILSALASHIATKSLTRPIRDLAKISKEMTNFNFEVKYNGNSAIEIDELGENMNQLSEKLEKTISELKKANNELKSDIELKEKNDQMRQEFLANVSHELKTPIALIQGYAEGLMEQSFEDEESRTFYCEVIQDEASKMNDLVKSLLALNQIEFGNEKIEFIRLDIVEYIRDVLNNFRLTCEQNGIELLFEATEPVFVWADEFKTEEVIRNFLTNAIHYAKEVDGEKKIEICISPYKDNNVQISVFNTGEPIPQEDITRIWEKFYKVDKARTREYGGNGIGLSIVKAIMDNMHKPYGVENYVNGVKFWFVLDGGSMEKKL